LFDQGCHLVILACNTASAKALRTIQQNDLPLIDPDRRVLGVIRPTVEKVGEISRNGNIGIVGTPGTIRSGSYELEIAKLHPTFHTYTQACPMWVPLVENREASSPGADYFVKQEVDRLMAKEPAIDTIILGCTHYPLLYDKIRRYVPESARVLPQGEIVAESLVAYLKRHPEMEAKCSKGGTCSYRTTESPDKFAELASLFIGAPVTATQIDCL
ncbi:glutamate racemase, partial [uncultured Muribaculum sp.]